MMKLIRICLLAGLLAPALPNGMLYAQQAAAAVSPDSATAAGLIPPAGDTAVPDPSIISAEEQDYYGSALLKFAALACAAGQSDECFSIYQQAAMSADMQQSYLALKNLGFVCYFDGDIKNALLYWERALKIKPNDSVIGLFKGWAYLSMGRNRMAIEAFQRAVSMADAPAVTADARIGEALALFFDRKYAEADKKLKAIYSTDPYSISFSAYMLNMASQARGDYLSAQVYAEQSLKHDSMNYSSALELYRLYNRTDDKLRAWQIFSTLAELEPDDAETAATLKRLGKSLGDNADRFSLRTRADMPINRFFRATPSLPVNAALYADRRGRPVELTAASFVAASSFAVCDLSAGPISRGNRGNEWSMRFNPQTREVSVLNNWGNVEYMSQQPFRLQPEAAGAGILIKNIETGGLPGSMLDDKELRGTITVIPSSGGFTLVNNTTLEDFVPGAMSPLKFSVKEPEALKALAVAVRTKIHDAVTVSTEPWYNFCDSDACLLYSGINTEMQAAVNATNATQGEILSSSAAGAFEACGGISEYGAQDTASVSRLTPSPAQRVERILALPPADLMCAPRTATDWAAEKWTVMLNAEEVNRRFRRIYKTRPVTIAAARGYSAAGRISDVLVKSRDKSFKMTAAEFNRLLAAGSLRSDLFYIIPVYDGSAISKFIVRGLGTGSGRGLCVRGAQKAADDGQDYKQILRHYFPDATLVNTTEKSWQNKQKE